MNKENAINLLPTYATEDYVRTYEPKKQAGKKEERAHMLRRFWNHMKEAVRTGFKRKYGIALIGAALFTIYSILLSAGVARSTEERVTAEVTSQLRADFQRYLDQQETERKAAQFLTGDASFEAAVEDLAVPMAQVIATYAMDYKVGQEGQQTIGWVFCARHAKNSTEFGRTPQEILEKKSAWEGSVVGHAVRNQDTELARSIARDYLSGKYPDNFTTDLTFFNREAGGKIIARNELYTGPYTTYWWLGK